MIILRDFFVVFCYSFKDVLKRPFLKIITIIGTILVILGMLLPDILISLDIFKFNREKKYYFYIRDDKNYIFDDHLDINIYMEEVNDKDERYFFDLVDVTDKQIEDDLKSGLIDGIVDVKGKNYIEIVTANSMPALKYLVNEFITISRLNELGIKYDIDEKKIKDIYGVQYSVENRDILKAKFEDMLEIYILPSVFVLFMYMIILIYGQLISINVNMEKNSKILESLLIKIKPVNIILGKTLGILFLGLIQVSYFVVLIFILTSLLGEEKFKLINSVMQFDVKFIINFMVHFILGSILYSLLFSFIGNFASKTEELSIFMAPILILLSIASFLSILSIQFPHNKIMILLMYVPFFTSMMSISNFSYISLFENFLGVFITIVFILLMIYFNILMYEKAILFREKK